MQNVQGTFKSRRTDVEAETPILWLPDAKNWLIGKDPDGKDWRQEEKGTTEYETVGWHHRLDWHEFDLALGVGDVQGKPGILQSTGSQIIGHHQATELNWGWLSVLEAAFHNWTGEGIFKDSNKMTSSSNFSVFFFIFL